MVPAAPVSAPDRRYRPDRPIVAEIAGGVVVVQAGTGRICLLHYAAEDRWGLPKGHVDPGESLGGAALREVREETGLSAVTLGPEVADVHYRFFDGRRGLNVYKIAVYFLGRTEETELRTEPIFDRAEWVDWATARSRLPFDTDREVLDAAARAGVSMARPP
ncbi:NUDIX hydrolase, core domain protein [mine drainage metagenome]|uniref:NUDIX hydrolase, core domain protein n=1 Tax=mine drainage metagenome TaxID=410659 RepID=T1CYI9_9ZZZZ